MNREDEKQHIFSEKCPKCGHVNYYDKRRVCSGKRDVYRGSEPEMLILSCDNCKHKFSRAVDCEGY
jgi:uncharacterized OB-fold protein